MPQPLSLSNLLTLPAPYISESYIKININLNFYFHTSLWCLKLYNSLSMYQDVERIIASKFLAQLLNFCKIYQWRQLTSRQCYYCFYAVS